MCQRWSWRGQNLRGHGKEGGGGDENVGGGRDCGVGGKTANLESAWKTGQQRGLSKPDTLEGPEGVASLKEPHKHTEELGFLQDW